MSGYSFVCPKCKEPSKIEEVMEGVTVTSDVAGVESDEVQYGEQTNEDGEVLWYQCGSCGEAIRDADHMAVDSANGLYKWLRRQKMLDDG